MEHLKPKSLMVPKPTFMASKGLSLDEIRALPFGPISGRLISKKVAEFYGVRLELNADNEVIRHYYPYEDDNCFNVRTLPKDFKTLGQFGPSLFGKEKFSGGGKRVILTEGEIDTLSIAEASFKRYNTFYPIVGIRGSTNIKSVLENREWLRSFKEVLLCMDNDTAGKEALSKIIKIVGYEKAKVIRLPLKDANEVLVKMGAEALMTRVFDAEKLIPAGIIGKEAIWESMSKLSKVESHPYPDCIRGLNDKLKGKREGEISLFISGTGCLGLGTPVLMYDGSLKLVENVEIGDLLMGDDSTPREVLKLARGQEKLWKVSIRDGSSFVCNESHMLTLIGSFGESKNQIVDVCLKDYLRWNAKEKHRFKLFKSGPLSFEESEVSLPIHPYVFGVWLGDGSSEGGRITKDMTDGQIIEKLEALGYTVKPHNFRDNSWLVEGLTTSLRKMGVLENKHIPEVYLKASLEQRFELLAGLLDTDGSLTQYNGYEFSQKSEVIIDQVVRLCNSLGFQASKGKQKNNVFGNCFRLHIGGHNLDLIPVALDRKRAREYRQIKDPLRFKMDLEELYVGDYYGFTLSGNSRFVLGNGIVTHNSGKSTVFREIMLHTLETTQDKIGVVSLEESPSETARRLSGMAVNKNTSKEDVPLEILKTGFDKVFGSDRVIMLDHQGSVADNSIMDHLEYMALSGCKYLFIDHITILVSEGIEDLRGLEAQDKLMNDLLRLVKRYPVWVGLISHLRKADNKQISFEEGRLPGIDDVRGSGSIKQISFDIIAFARNMVSSDPVERNTIKLRVLKCRHTGLTGDADSAFYEYETGRLVYKEDSGDEFVMVKS